MRRVGQAMSAETLTWRSIVSRLIMEAQCRARVTGSKEDIKINLMGKTDLRNQI